MENITTFLKIKLRPKINSQKSVIGILDKGKFLGIICIIITNISVFVYPLKPLKGLRLKFAKQF